MSIEEHTWGMIEARVWTPLWSIEPHARRKRLDYMLRSMPHSLDMLSSYHMCAHVYQ